MDWQVVIDAAEKHIEKNEEITIVLGNESCDIDSVVCTLVYAYAKMRATAIKNNRRRFIPVLNICKEDKILRSEVFLFLKKWGVPIHLLQLRDKIKLEDFKSFGTQLEVILVDHHVLSERDLWLKSHVVEVVDHRPVDPDWGLEWKYRCTTIEAVASCATLIAEKILYQDDFTIPRNMLILLYGAIILDTWNFSNYPKIYTEKDLAIADNLEEKINNVVSASGFISRQCLFNELLANRCNIKHLSPTQILRKDLKIVFGIPISALPLLTQDFLKLNTAEEELKIFSENFEHNCVLLIGVTYLDGHYKQDLAIFSTNEAFLNMPPFDRYQHHDTKMWVLFSNHCISETGDLDLTSCTTKKYSLQGKPLISRWLHAKWMNEC